MFHVGFIVNAEGESPKTFCETVQAEAITIYAAATSNLDMAIECAREMQAKGVTNLDLCGDFDTEMAEKISGALGGELTVKCAKYFEAQEKKLETVRMDKYAFVVKYDSLDPSKHVVEHSFADFTLRLVGVPSVEEAVRTINALQEEGYEFFELCSGFPADETTEVIEKTGNKSAIGSAGL